MCPALYDEWQDAHLILTFIMPVQVQKLPCADTGSCSKSRIKHGSSHWEPGFGAGAAAFVSFVS